MPCSDNGEKEFYYKHDRQQAGLSGNHPDLPWEIIDPYTKDTIAAFTSQTMAASFLEALRDMTKMNYRMVRCPC